MQIKSPFITLNLIIYFKSLFANILLRKKLHGYPKFYYIKILEKVLVFSVYAVLIMQLES